MKAEQIANMDNELTGRMNNTWTLRKAEYILNKENELLERLRYLNKDDKLIGLLVKLEQIWRLSKTWTKIMNSQ